MANPLKLNSKGDKYTIRFADWTGKQDTMEQWARWCESEHKRDYKVAHKFQFTFDSVCLTGSMKSCWVRKIREKKYAWEFKADHDNVCWRAGAFIEAGVWYITHFWKTDHRGTVGPNGGVTESARREHLEKWNQ